MGPTLLRDRAKIIGLLPAVCLLLIALWEVVRIASAGGGVPSEADWRTASQSIRQKFTAGDWIVFSPKWLEPVGRHHLGDLMWTGAGPMDMARFDTIWELSARSARAAEVAGMKPVDTSELGPFTLRKYQQTPAKILTDFTRRLSPRVQVVNGRATQSIEEVDFEARRCMRLEPSPQGMQLTFSNMTLGRELVGYVGMADAFARQLVYDQFTLEVEVDGHSLQRTAFDIYSGWVRFVAPTSASALSTVTFRIQIENPTPHPKVICLAVEARE